jgi:hypothetical protein
MEAGERLDPRAQLSMFCNEVANFVEGVADGLPDSSDGFDLRNGVEECRTRQLTELKAELDATSETSLAQAGLTGTQLQAKLEIARRGMQSVGRAKGPRRPWFSVPWRRRNSAPTGPRGRAWRKSASAALGKIKVVLGSLRGLSKWVEALVELVDLADKLVAEQ